jgi:DNA-binding Lrp family transcriptional regulator
MLLPDMISYSSRMPAAIVLINSEIGRETDILDHLCKMPEVEKAFLVYGVYDVVAKVQAETMDALEAAITTKVRKLKGIRSTLTLIVSRECK